MGVLERHRLRHDLSQPIRYIDGNENRKQTLQEADDAWNRFALSDRELRGQTTQVRVSFDAWSRTPKGMSYVRLRGKHSVLMFPSAEQAELAIQLITQVIRSLDGKLLAPADSGTSPRG